MEPATGDGNPEEYHMEKTENESADDVDHASFQQFTVKKAAFSASTNYLAFSAGNGCCLNLKPQALHEGPGKQLSEPTLTIHSAIPGPFVSNRSAGGNKGSNCPTKGHYSY